MFPTLEILQYADLDPLMTETMKEWKQALQKKTLLYKICTFLYKLFNDGVYYTNYIF